MTINFNARIGEQSGGNFSFGFSRAKFSMNGEEGVFWYPVTSFNAATIGADLGTNVTLSWTNYMAEFEKPQSIIELATKFEGYFRNIDVTVLMVDGHKTVSVDENNKPTGPYEGYGFSIVLGSSIIPASLSETLQFYGEAVSDEDIKKFGRR